MGRGLPTGGWGLKVYVLCAEPKEHEHFRPGTRPGGSGTRPGGSVTGVTEKLFMCQMFMCLFRPLHMIVLRWGCDRGCSAIWGSKLDEPRRISRDAPPVLLRMSLASPLSRMCRWPHENGTIRPFGVFPLFCRHFWPI